MKHHNTPFTVHLSPQKGSEHYRVLQSFADMDGNNFNRRLISFKAYLILLRLIGGTDPFAKPRSKPFHPEPPLMLLFVQQFKTVQEISQPSLA